jgi:hypothetical protein
MTIPGASIASMTLSAQVGGATGTAALKLDSLCSPDAGVPVSFMSGTLTDGQQVTAKVGLAAFWITLADTTKAKTFMDAVAAATPGCAATVSANPKTYDSSFPVPAVGDQAFGAKFRGERTLSVFVRKGASIYRLDTFNLSEAQAAYLATYLLPGTTAPPAAATKDRLIEIEPMLAAVSRLDVAIYTQFRAMTVSEITGACAWKTPLGTNTSVLNVIAGDATTGLGALVQTSRFSTNELAAANLNAARSLAAGCQWAIGQQAKRVEAAPVAKPATGDEAVEFSAVDTVSGQKTIFTVVRRGAYVITIRSDRLTVAEHNLLVTSAVAAS